MDVNTQETSPATVSAQSLVDAWCAMCHRRADELPLLAVERGAWRSLGPLVYALRIHAQLGVIETANQLGVEGCYAMQIQQRARPAIEVERDPRMVQQLHTLLGLTAGGEPKPQLAQVQVRMPDTPDAWEALRHANQPDKLNAIGKRVCRILDREPSQVFSKSRLGYLVRPRQITFAIAYAAAKQRSMSAIGRHFGKDHTTVLSSMEAVRTALSGFGCPALRGETLKVCQELQIDLVERLHGT